MKKYAAVSLLLLTAALSGCNDPLSCDNPDSIRAINEVVTNNALSKMSLSSYKSFNSVGLAQDSLALALDNIYATDSNQAVNSLTCKAQLTATYSDKEKARLKRTLGVIEGMAKGGSGYSESHLFIDNINATAMRMTDSRTVTGTVVFTVYNTKNKVITEVANTTDVNNAIDAISYKLLYPAERLYAVQNNTFPLNRFYTREILSMFSQ